MEETTWRDQLTQIVDAIAAGIFVLDGRGRVLFANPEAARIMNLQRSAMVGRRFDDPAWRMTRPDGGSLPAEERVFSQVTASRRPVYRSEYAVRRLDDSVVIISCNGAPLINEEGELTAVVVSFIDITELRRKTEQFEAQYKGFPIPTFTWQHREDEFVLIDFNEAARSFTHMKISDFRGFKAREFFSDAPEILSEMSRCFKSKCVCHREMDYRLRTTGETKHLFITYAYVPPDLMMVHTEDATAKKIAEEQYKTIIKTAMDGFWLTDADGRFLDVNDAYRDLIGYSRDELLGMGVRDVEALETTEETDRHIERVKKTGRDRFTTRHRRKDGKLIDLEVSVHYLDSEGGRFFVFLREIGRPYSTASGISG